MWFLIHRAIQVTGVWFALSGFIIAVTQFSVFHPGYFAAVQAWVYGMHRHDYWFFQPLTPIFAPKSRSIHVVKNVNTGNGCTRDRGGLLFSSRTNNLYWNHPRWRRPLLTLSNYLRSFIAMLMTIIFFLIQDRKKYVPLRKSCLLQKCPKMRNTQIIVYLIEMM